MPAQAENKTTTVSHMRLAIVVAMQEEQEQILVQLQQAQTVTRAGMCFHQGTYLGQDVVVVVCGVGKVNAAACAQLLISEFHISHMINIGVAGAVQGHLQMGDIVIGGQLIQHDVDLQALGLAPGHMFRMPSLAYDADPQLLQLAQQAAHGITAQRSYTGIIVTGDQFIACNDKIQRLAHTFQALACEMESASLAQVCSLNQIPFIAIRSISDQANHAAQLDFQQFLAIAARNASALLHAMVPFIQPEAETTTTRTDTNHSPGL